jgi:peptidoglycan/LPS O-acetylase OafA/YrhL
MASFPHPLDSRKGARMTRSRLRSLLTLIVWLLVAIGFAWTVFSDGGSATYADDTRRRLLGGAVLAAGIFGTPLMRLLTRRGSPADRVDRDERDEEIEARATRIGLVSVVTLVFLGAIALWDSHQEPGCVPVGWMWVLAYATLILSHLAPAAVSLDRGAPRHAED